MRALAATLAAVPGGLARVVQARVDQGGGELLHLVLNLGEAHLQYLGKLR